MKKYSRSRKNKRLVIAAFLLFAAIVGSLVEKKYNVSSRPQIPPSQEQVGTVLVTLFFADENGDRLVREGREIVAGSDLAESVATVVNELISGPVGDYQPVLPYNTQIRGVTINGDEAVIDLGKGFIETLPGGSSAEMVAVYSVIDTIAVNYPQIKKVQFLIDGDKVSTLKGHLDLRQPLVPDYNMEKRQ